MPAPVQNAETSEILFLLVGWFDVWMMPILFLLSGFSTWYSLRRRSGRQYLVERVKRLLLPLYTVGLFVILVPQSYFMAVSFEGFEGTFWQWIPRYLGRLFSFQFSG